MDDPDYADGITVNDEFPYMRGKLIAGAIIVAFMLLARACAMMA